MILRGPYAKVGKRVAARLEGKTLGACHKCGASLGRNRSSSPRARYCVRCGTIYHTYDCGRRMAAVLPASDPADCPKVRRGNLSKIQPRASLTTKPSSWKLTRKRVTSPKSQTVLWCGSSAATSVVACLDPSSVIRTGSESGRKSAGLKSWRKSSPIRVWTMTTALKSIKKRKTTHATSNSQPKKDKRYARPSKAHGKPSKKGWVLTLRFLFSNKRESSPRWRVMRKHRVIQRNHSMQRSMQRENQSLNPQLSQLLWNIQYNFYSSLPWKITVQPSTFSTFSTPLFSQQNQLEKLRKLRVEAIILFGGMNKNYIG